MMGSCFFSPFINLFLKLWSFQVQSCFLRLKNVLKATLKITLLPVLCPWGASVSLLSTERGVCLPTVSLWILFVYIEAAIRFKDLKNFHVDLCRPFAAHWWVLLWPLFPQESQQSGLWFGFRACLFSLPLKLLPGDIPGEMCGHEDPVPPFCAVSQNPKNFLRPKTTL